MNWAIPNDAHSLVKDFLRHLQVIRFASLYTLVAYCADVSEFEKFSGNKFPGKVGRLDVRAFLAGLQVKGLQAATIRRKVASLKSFYRHLIRTRVVSANPFAGISGPRRSRSLPKFLTQPEAHRLMEQPDVRTLAGRRDLAILEIIYSSGLRLSEMVALRVCDFDFHQRLVKVAGKGRRERILPFGGYAARAIQTYLKAAPIAAEGFIFRNLHGQHITGRSVERIIEKYLCMVGRPELSAHSLRHSFATHMLENGCDIRYIQAFLGHASISTTVRYCHCNLALLKRSYDVMNVIRDQMSQEKLFSYQPEWEAIPA